MNKVRCSSILPERVCTWTLALSSAEEVNEFAKAFFRDTYGQFCGLDWRGSLTYHRPTINEDSDDDSFDSFTFEVTHAPRRFLPLFLEAVQISHDRDIIKEGIEAVDSFKIEESVPSKGRTFTFDQVGESYRKLEEVLNRMGFTIAIFGMEAPIFSNRTIGSAITDFSGRLPITPTKNMPRSLPTDDSTFKQNGLQESKREDGLTQTEPHFSLVGGLIKARAPEARAAEVIPLRAAEVIP